VQDMKIDRIGSFYTPQSKLNESLVPVILSKLGHCWLEHAGQCSCEHASL